MVFVKNKSVFYCAKKNLERKKKREREIYHIEQQSDRIGTGVKQRILVQIRYIKKSNLAPRLRE